MVDSFGADFLETAIFLSYAGLLLSFVLSLLRLALGPTLADRVVALDVVSFLTIGFIAVYSLDQGTEAFLDIAITLALVAFLGTIAFARFIMKRTEASKEE